MLVISFVLPGVYLSFIPKAEAQWIVWDPGKFAWDNIKWAWDKVVDYVEKYGRIVARLMARMILQNMIQETVNWVNSGFEGSPMFMTNPGQFLQNSADSAVGEFIGAEGSPLAFLCDPFKLNVRVNLGLKYSVKKTKEVGCTMSGVLGNIQGAYDDFTNGNFISTGGWNSWMQMAGNPENTPQGSAMMSQNVLQEKIDKVQTTLSKEADWGLGALGMKKCENVVHTEYDDNDEPVEVSEEVCNTQTPGATIMDSLNRTQTTGQNSGELESIMSDGINAILGAFANQLMSMTLGQAQQGLLGGENRNVDYQAQMNENLSQSQANLEAQNRQIDADGNKNGSSTAATPLEKKRAELRAIISDYLSRNKSYLAAYAKTTQTLYKAKTEFEKAKTCCQLNNIGGGDPNSSRAGIIQANLIDKITGLNTTQTAPITLATLIPASDAVRTNIRNLEEMLTRVNSASATEADLNEETPRLNAIIANTKEPMADMETRTQAWLNSNYGNYSAPPCIITRTW